MKKDRDSVSEMKKKKFFITGASGFIGTPLASNFISEGIDFINIDITQPKKPEQIPYWRQCNILDVNNLEKIIQEYQPTDVIHLAARATTNGKTLADYQDNTTGTGNVLNAIKKIASVARVIITSSQHVRKPGSGFPNNDTDFVPHGLYGESKVITENLTREANLNCEWVIIRPTSVWGPYHPFLAAGLWNLMSKGWYVHPKNDPVVRSYGYVKNIAWMIEKLLNAPSNTVDQRVFYLGDEPIKQSEWIDAFSLALTGRSAPKIPKEWISFLAKIGDGLERIGVRFPMNSPRYFNLTTTNPVRIDHVIKQFGTPPYTFEEGISETVSWLKSMRIGN